MKIKIFGAFLLLPALLSVARAESRWVVLSSKTVDAGDGPKLMVLEHEDIASKGSDSCVVLRLKTADMDAKEVWSGCLWHARIVYPHPLISGDFVADKSGKRFMTAIALSYTSDLEIGLFPAKPDGSNSVRTVRNQKGEVSNTKEMSANFKAHLARNKAQFSIDDECGAYMSLDGLSVSSGKVRVSAKSKPGLSRPNQPSCGSRIVEYDLASKTWSVVQDGGIALRKK